MYPGITLGQVIEILELKKEETCFAYRKGWNGKGIHIKLQVPDDHSKMSLPYLYIETVDLESDNPDAPRGRVPWLASQTDILSKDWIVHFEDNDGQLFEIEGSFFAEETINDLKHPERASESHLLNKWIDPDGVVFEVGDTVRLIGTRSGEYTYEEPLVGVLGTTGPILTYDIGNGELVSIPFSEEAFGFNKFELVKKGNDFGDTIPSKK